MKEFDKNLAIKKSPRGRFFGRMKIVKVDGNKN